MSRCCCSKSSFGASFILLAIGVVLFLSIAKWLIILALIWGLLFYTTETIIWLVIGALLTGLEFLFKHLGIPNGVEWLIVIMLIIGSTKKYWTKKEVNEPDVENSSLALKNSTTVLALPKPSE